MDVEYFCSYASDVLYGYHDTEIILMSFIVLVGKFVLGQEINMLLVMMQHWKQLLPAWKLQIVSAVTKKTYFCYVEGVTKVGRPWGSWDSHWHHHAKWPELYGSKPGYNSQEKCATSFWQGSKIMVQQVSEIRLRQDSLKIFNF